MARSDAVANSTSHGGGSPEPSNTDSTLPSALRTRKRDAHVLPWATISPRYSISASTESILRRSSRPPPESFTSGRIHHRRAPTLARPFVPCMMCSLVFLVFSQHPDTVLPVDRLIAQARAHFAATVELVDQSPDGPRVTLSYDAHGSRHPFAVESRRALAADLDAARAAENVNRGAGLADLAGRCGWVWTVVAREEAPEWLSLDFCALLA